MSRALPCFVPVSSSDLARASLDDDLVFLGDVQPAQSGEPGRLVHALGCALPGRLVPQSLTVPPALSANAVRADGTLVEVALASPIDERSASAPVGVFVYGTLMRGEERDAAVRSVLGDADPEEGFITGGLVHLGAWPGLVAGAGQVHGELLRSPELAPLLGVLDPIEDFVDFRATPTEYVRVVVPVITASGLAWAWTYRFVGDASDAMPIPSGRWRDVPRRLPGTEGMRRRTDAV